MEIMELQKQLTGIKTHWMSSIVEMIEDGSNKSEDRSIEFTQSEQRRTQNGKIGQSLRDLWGMAIEPTLPNFPETLETIEQDSCNNTTFPKKPSGRSLKMAREEEEENSHNSVDNINSNNKILHVCNIFKSLKII